MHVMESVAAPPAQQVSNDDSNNAKKRKKRKKNKEKDTGNPFANPPKKQKTEEANSSSKAPLSAVPSATRRTDTPKEDTKGPSDISKLPPYSSFASPPKTSSSKPAAALLDFRSLNLPVAPFPMSALPASSQPKNADKGAESTPPKTPAVTPSSPDLPDYPLPVSSEAGRKWLGLVKKTRASAKFASAYDLSRYKDMDEEIGYSVKNWWVSTKPYGAWCRDLPQVVAVDCEMCETQDPVSGRKDARALCRISIVDAGNGEVLLDSLVKPNWPVVNYRTFVNGITEEHLESVKFTLRHAQAFLLALCSQETVMIGHALQNDLAAMRLEHYCVVDSSHLYDAVDNPEASVSLRDLASTVLKQAMPEVHDSVNDARTALACVKHYLDCKGRVDKIVRTFQSRPNYGAQLFLHRIPKTCEASHISEMFLAHTSVQPLEVDEIAYSGDSGKALVHFRSTAHAKLAFDCLESKVETDASGRLQKKVFLRGGGYVRVRKMAFERPKQASDGDNSNKSGEAKVSDSC
jgi:RNA exonuclease 1